MESHVHGNFCQQVYSANRKNDMNNMQMNSGVRCFACVYYMSTLRLTTFTKTKCSYAPLLKTISFICIIAQSNVKFVGVRL